MAAMNDDSIILHHQQQQHLFATPVTCQARSNHNHDHGPAVPLAPRPSATTLLPEALSSGPSFPCLETLTLPRETPISEPQDHQEGDDENVSSSNNNNHGRRSSNTRNCSDKHKHRRIRTLSPPTIIRLRPRFTRYTYTAAAGKTDDSISAVVSNFTVVQSSSFAETSRKNRDIMKNPDLEGDTQSMRRASLLDGHIQISSFPRAA